MSTWHDQMPTHFTFHKPTYCETCGNYGVSLDVDLDGELAAVSGEWGCTGGMSWYPDESYTGAELYRELIEAGYDERMRFDPDLEYQRPAWLEFLAAIKNDHTPHAVQED